MLTLALALLAAQTPQHRMFRQPDLPPAVRAPAGLNAGIRAWWSGDALGTQWSDRSGLGKHLTLAGSSVPFSIPQSWEFNGHPAAHFYATDTQYAEVATAADWTFLTQSTGHTGYVQFVTQRSAGGIIASSFADSFGNGAGIGVWNGTQQLRLYVSNGSGAIASYVSGASDIPYGTITTVVWRLNGTTNKFNVRINGVQVDDSAASGYTNTAPAQKLRLGSYSTPTQGTPYGGLISDFALWDRPLSDAEVTTLEAWGGRTATSAFVVDTTVLSPALTGTVKVMYVGDSITEGVTGATTLVGGFRHRVFDLDCGTDAGVPIDGIGPYIGTLTPNGYADNQSNGVGGAIIKNAGAAQRGHASDSALCVAAPGGCINTIIGAGNSYRPDVIVLLLGINSISGIAEADAYREAQSSSWCSFVVDMHIREPAARFVLGSLLPKNPSIPQTAAFNRAEMACASYLQANGVKFVRWDSAAAISSPATQLSDGLHPNDIGYSALGDYACPAIRRAMGYPAGLLPDGGTP